MPRCSTCAKDKPKTEFYWIKNPPAHYAERPYRWKQCKACCRRIAREKYAKYTAAHRLKWRVWWSKNKDRYNAVRRARRLETTP